MQQTSNFPIAIINLKSDSYDSSQRKAALFTNFDNILGHILGSLEATDCHMYRLYEGPDLYPTTDLRSVFKGVLADHLPISEG